MIEQFDACKFLSKTFYALYNQAIYLSSNTHVNIWPTESSNHWPDSIELSNVFAIQVFL
jgi:hypothetical protein